MQLNQPPSQGQDCSRSKVLAVSLISSTALSQVGRGQCALHKVQDPPPPPSQHLRHPLAPPTSLPQLRRRKLDKVHTHTHVICLLLSQRSNKNGNILYIMPFFYSSLAEVFFPTYFISAFFCLFFLKSTFSCSIWSG